MSIAPAAIRRPFRSAFTLVELLVVIATITGLMSMLLPSLQQAREVAFRAKCGNNEKQIGIAHYAYLGDYGVFPLGTTIKGYPGPAPASLYNSGPYRPGAFAAILPYIGRGDVYQDLRMDLAIDEAPNITAGQAIIQLYLCPSSQHTYGLTKAPHSLPLSNTALKYGVIDYNGLNGLNRLYTNSPSTSVTSNHGSFAEDKALKLEDFSDGAASAIMISETVNFGRGVWIHGRPHYNQAAYAINSLSGFNNAANSVFPDGSNLPVTNRGPGKGSAGTWGISSYHPGGANALFVDGSVRFLTNDTPPWILQTLITRDAKD